jgi:hypothetical protein
MSTDPPGQSIRQLFTHAARVMSPPRSDVPDEDARHCTCTRKAPTHIGRPNKRKHKILAQAGRPPRPMTGRVGQNPPTVAFKEKSRSSPSPSSGPLKVRFDYGLGNRPRVCRNLACEAWREHKLQLFRSATALSPNRDCGGDLAWMGRQTCIRQWLSPSCFQPGHSSSLEPWSAHPRPLDEVDIQVSGDTPTSVSDFARWHHQHKGLYSHDGPWCLW